MARHSNAQVAHIWAHQSAETGTSHNGNFSFHGSHIDSYSTPVANIVECERGGRVALVTSKTYSVTTSGKHMGPIYRALDYGRSFIKVFTVPFIGCRGGRNYPDSFDMAEVHAGNVAAFRQQYADMVATQTRRQSFVTEADVLGYLNGIANTACVYVEAFGLPVMIFDTDADAAAISAKHAARNTPAAIAKRERAAVARVAAKARREEREAAARFERDQDRRASFYAGTGPGYGLTDATGGALLRVKGETLQTSLGAEVPLSHAVKVFRFVKLCRERGEVWARNGRTIRVGHFQVDRIEASGNFVAGCHRINWHEVDRMAMLLGLHEVEASADAVEPTHAAA